jgi:hypothetical protein
MFAVSAGRAERQNAGSGAGSVMEFLARELATPAEAQRAFPHLLSRRQASPADLGGALRTRGVAAAGSPNRAGYRRRSAIECTVGALKEARAAATRYEKLAIHYLGLVKLGIIRMLLKRLDAPLRRSAWSGPSPD